MTTQLLTSFSRIHYRFAARCIVWMMTLLITLTFDSALSAADTQVILIGTHHAIMAMPAEYTPAHLRALLDKIKPDVVAVEASSNAADPLQTAPPEILRVVRPWATEKSIALVPIGWNQEQFAEQTKSMLDGLQAGPLRQKYQQIEQQFQQHLGAIPPTYQALNSDGHHQVWREYVKGIHDLVGKPTPWEEWNEKIGQNVVKTCEQHAGKRVAVVIGAAHIYYLTDAVSKEKGIQVLRTDQFFPLTLSEIASADKPIDTLAALTPLNQDFLPPSELSRLEPLLERIKDTTELLGDYHLYRGKFLLLAHRPAEALKEFEKLGTFDRSAKSHVDGTSSLFDTGLVYTAIALLQSGDALAARQRLDAVLADTKTDQTTRRWAEQVLAQAPKK